MHGSADGHHVLHEFLKDAANELFGPVERVGSHAWTDQSGGQVAAEKAISFDKPDADPKARGSDGRGNARGAAANDEDIDLVEFRNGRRIFVFAFGLQHRRLPGQRNIDPPSTSRAEP